MDEAVSVLPHQWQWQESPSEGVSRLALEREFAEHGHTTSLVRFAPGSAFRPHVHPLGEEIYVLEGVFSDERGDYPAGTYLRNPPGSRHAPFTQQGCLLFVKLDQFAANDLEPKCILPQEREWRPGLGNLSVLSLHEFQAQHTALVHWPAHEVFQPHRHWGGEEIMVLAGEFCDEHGRYPQYSWLRSPHLSQHQPYVEEETLILVKVGHLPQGSLG